MEKLYLSHEGYLKKMAMASFRFAYHHHGALLDAMAARQGVRRAAPRRVEQ